LDFSVNPAAAAAQERDCIGRLRGPLDLDAASHRSLKRVAAARQQRGQRQQAAEPTTSYRTAHRAQAFA
jgi:hypothetical protein